MWKIHQCITGELQRGKNASGGLFCSQQRKENYEGPGEENSFLHIGKLAVLGSLILFERKPSLILGESKELCWPLKREVSQNVSHRARESLYSSLYFTLTREPRENVSGQKIDLGKGVGFPRMKRRPCPRISCRTPLFPFYQEKTSWTRISYLVQLQPAICDKQLC